MTAKRGGLAMTILQFLPAQVQGGLDHDVRQLAEMVGDAFDGVQPGQILGQEAKYLGMVFFPQDVHFPFGIAPVLVEAGPQFGTEGSPVGTDFEQTGVEELVEDQRMAVQVFGRPR